MTKIFIGAVVGACLAVSGVAFASSVLTVGDSVAVTKTTTLYRVVDSSKGGAVCYVAHNASSLAVSVSCVK